MCPMYEYKCRACTSVFERYEPSTKGQSSPICTCGRKTEKVPSIAFAQFFGAGAYATEYGSQWRNRDGSAFYKQNAGKEPRDQVSGQPHDPTSWEKQKDREER